MMTLAEFTAINAPVKLTIKLHGKSSTSVSTIHVGAADAPEVVEYLNNFIERALHTAKDKYLVYLTEEKGNAVFSCCESTQISIFG